MTTQRPASLPNELGGPDSAQLGEPDLHLRVAGAVLCGGASRRMGFDKAMMLIDGEACAVRVARAIHGADVAPVVAVGGRRDVLESVGLTVIDDQFPGEGPLGGIICALEALADVADVVMILACDLPDADPRAITQVLAPFLTNAHIDVVIPRRDGRRHMHHGAWRTRILPTLRDEFASGERAPRRVLERLAVHELDADSGFDPRWLRDVDEPADLRARQATQEPTDIAGVSQS